MVSKQNFIKSPNESSDAKVLRRELSIKEEELFDAQTRIRELLAEVTELKARITEQGALLRQAGQQSVDDAQHIAASNMQIEEQSAEINHGRQLRAELEAINKELETFSYSVSHDLRAPLRAINGFAKALVEDFKSDLPPEAQRYLEYIDHNSTKMGDLISDLLAFSRLSRSGLNCTIVDVGGIVQSAWNEIHAGNKDMKVALQVQKMPQVMGDRAMLKQVFLNLLSNAAKFSSKKDSAKIEIGWYSDDAGNVVLFVADNGVGFDPRYADKLFGPFQRLHKAKDFEGTGIGLAIVQRIAHRHGGKVWGESEPGQGAKFFFSIPDRGITHERG